MPINGFRNLLKKTGNKVVSVPKHPKCKHCDGNHTSRSPCPNEIALKHDKVVVVPLSGAFSEPLAFDLRQWLLSRHQHRQRQ